MSDDKEDVENDGLRPDDREGPDASAASPSRCEYRQGERTEGAGESVFLADEELHEAFPVEPIPVVMGADGLPTFVDTAPEDTIAVPFTYETQLCVEDDREFVEIFKEELIEAGWKRGLLRRSRWISPLGAAMDIRVCSRFDDRGGHKERRSFQPEKVQRRWGIDVMRQGSYWLPVRPLRERCRHLQRQVFSNDSQPDPAMDGHQIVFRVCAARRSNGGAFMSLGNEGIYACDFRDPPDQKTTYLQDCKDRNKLLTRPDLLRLPLFNTPGETVQLENKT